jgi:hypothetical protein
MGFVPGLEHDCFLSYRHLDDLGVDGSPGQGWVTQFHHGLTVKLGEYLGSAPNIWRDPRLDGNDVFPAELHDRVAASAALIPIVSPGYRGSDWCRREFATFRETAEKAHRWTVGNKLSVLKVVRTPLDGEEHQVFPVDALGYPFFETNRDTGRPIRFDSGSAPYTSRIEELAQDVAVFLKRLAEGTNAPPAPVGANRSAAAPVRPRTIVLACDLFGFGPGARVAGVSCVMVDDVAALAARIGQLKSTLAVDPAMQRTTANELGRRGFLYEADGPEVRDRFADLLAVLPWDGYVSFADAAQFAGGREQDTVLQLLRGVLFDRIRSLFAEAVDVVLSPQLATFVQSISDAASAYRREIKAMDKVSVIGTSLVRTGRDRDAVLEVANYLGGITEARLVNPDSVDARRFVRVYPNKLRLLHDMGAHVHYSRHNPFPASWRLPG